MKILLTAATTFEIEPTLQLLEKEGFTLNEHEIDILITGIGPVPSTYLLTSAIHSKKPDLVIQAGIAGSFNTQQLPIGQTVLVKWDAFGDMGMEEKGVFTTVFDAGFAGKNHFPFTDGWLINLNPLLNNASLPVVKSVTINKVSDNPVQKKQLEDTFSPLTESMEGAALHYVCLQQHISFLQIRTVSNEVGERDIGDWKMKEAIENLNMELQQLLGIC
jgi:futalosine hydrolase